MPRTKAKGPNKSAAVREYLDAHKRATPKEIIAALKEKGIDVSAQMVSTIKTKYKKRRGRKRDHGVGNGFVGRRGRSSNGTIAIEQLIVAKRFADQCGGIDRAQEALAVLAKLN